MIGPLLRNQRRERFLRSQQEAAFKREEMERKLELRRRFDPRPIPGQRTIDECIADLPETARLHSDLPETFAP